MSQTLDKVPDAPGNIAGKTTIGRLAGVIKAYPMGNRQYVALRE